MQDSKVEALNNALAVGAMSKRAYLMARADLAEAEAIAIIQVNPAARERQHNEGWDDRLNGRRDRRKYSS
jgi:tRNA U34 5-carboxymethylaminomethyl modifying GTPase MnmE/TrmE